MSNSLWRVSIGCPVEETEYFQISREAIIDKRYSQLCGTSRISPVCLTKDTYIYCCTYPNPFSSAFKKKKNYLPCRFYDIFNEAHTNIEQNKFIFHNFIIRTVIFIVLIRFPYIPYWFWCF